MVPRPEAPIVHDLDTGIRWPCDWHHHHHGDMYVPTVGEKVQPAGKIEGVVRECHVIGSVGNENARFNTILVLEPPADAGGYR